MRAVGEREVAHRSDRCGVLRRRRAARPGREPAVPTRDHTTREREHRFRAGVHEPRDAFNERPAGGESTALNGNMNFPLAILEFSGNIADR